jgi:uncharacterized protein (DUF1778 family)
MDDATAAKLDQVHFVVEDTTFEQLAALLDSPATPNEGLERLLAVRPPWHQVPDQL